MILFNKHVRKLIVPFACMLSFSLMITPGLANAVDYHALVIGAQSYREYPLSTPASNASAVAETLTILGFDVDERIDKPNHELRESVRLLGEKSKDSEFVVLYFSGHTIKLGNNQYLIPSDVDLRSRADLRKLVDIQSLLGQLENADVALVVIDGCAQARFARGWGDTFGRSPVCANEASQLQLPANTTLVVSDSAADTSTLGIVSGRLNLYTEVFLDSLDSDAPITDVIKNVNAQVEKVSEGAQVPQIFGNTQQLISFRGPAPGAEVQAVRKADALAGSVQILEPGVYQIENTRTARLLAVDQLGSLALAEAKENRPSTDWIVDLSPSGLYSFRSRQGGKALVVDNSLVQLQFSESSSNAHSAWQLPIVEFGSPGERNISVASGSFHLSVRGNAVVLNRNSRAGAAGWVFRRTGAIDDATIVPPAEVKPDDTFTNMDSPAMALTGVSDNSVPLAQKADQPIDTLGDDKVSNDALPVATMVFNQFKASLEAMQLEQIKQMMQPGSSQDAFIHLVSGYDELIVDLGEVKLDQSNDSFHADLTVLQLQLDQDYIEPLGALRKARLVLKASDIGDDVVLYARHCRPDCIPASDIVAAFQGEQ